MHEATRAGAGGDVTHASGSIPLTSTTVRPALVEPPPVTVPSAEVHGPPSVIFNGAVDNSGREATPAPEYMRQALRTLTRGEGLELLLKLRARRMRNRLSRFIRGHDGTGNAGAWHVLEHGIPLEWNFHHDALCDHYQVMIEEWHLAGIKKPELVGKTLAVWRQEAELERKTDPESCEARIAMVDGMLEHWLRPVIPVDDGKPGCGGGRYIQRTENLAINVGPISLKSRIFMVFGIAWAWLRWPTWEVFCASGTPANVSRDSRHTRDLVMAPWYRETFGISWEIRDDESGIEKWSTTAGGSRTCKGTGAAVTGIHVDCILVDDPDDAAHVWSEVSREGVWKFWLSIGNRLKDPTRPCRMFVQQNLHAEDLTTKLVASGLFPRLAIPVEFDPAARSKLYSAPFGWRDPRESLGANLHSIRFTAKYLDSERVRLGTHGFEAQYNCNPTPLDGGWFQRGWFQFFRVQGDTTSGTRQRPTGCEKALTFTLGRRARYMPRNDVPWLAPELAIYDGLDLDWFTISVDATFGSKKATASAVAILVAGGKGNKRFIFEVTAEPMTFLETVAAIKGVLGRWPVRKAIIELKANGAAIIEELTTELAAGNIKGPDGRTVNVVVEPIEPEGGKESRAAAMMGPIQNGTVYLLEGAHWLEKFLGEVCLFPNSNRDDQVDALSQLLNHYRTNNVAAQWAALAGRPRA